MNSMTYREQIHRLLERADDDTIELVYALLTRLTPRETRSQHFDYDAFLQRLRSVQGANAFQTIEDSVIWQRQARDEWK